MLRRNPTALTISPEDITAFDQVYARKKAYQHFKRTGEDPHNLFAALRQRQQQQQQQQQRQRRQQNAELNSEDEYEDDDNNDDDGGDVSNQTKQKARQAHHHHRIATRPQTTEEQQQQDPRDPNDELKPLPGDKARIVRSRDQRIMGVGAGAGPSQSTTAGSSRSTGPSGR